MKIYISKNKPELENYTHVQNIMTLDDQVLDREATDLVVKDYLTEFADSEVGPLLLKILSKLRIDATITIVDKDIDIIYMKYDRGDMDLKTLNDTVFSGLSKKCFLNIETVKDVIKDKLKIEHSSVDSQTGQFIIKARRVANG
jgi:hypothetical protein